MELTQEILRCLYLDEGLSETKIAKRFGTYQVKVSRLRRKWGIPTLSLTERVSSKLPSLTPLQKEVVVGSLLGDGWMQATSKGAARFADGHCESQAGYTEWKAELLKPFVSNLRWGTKEMNGRVFRNRSFTTTSCRQLRPFYDLFYPKGKRVFPATLPDLMTPLVFAIWYLDDGSVAGGRNARISFGLDDLSLKRALKAIRRLGLKPKVYGEGSNRGIHFMGQTQEFLAIVAPHVPEGMRYKLPVETDRQKVDRNARKLTPDKAAQLASGGLGNLEIAQMYGVGSSTVRRRLRAAGVRRKPGPKSKTGVSAATELLQTRYPDTSLWISLSQEQQKEWVEDVWSVLRKTAFPFPEQVTTKLRDRHLKRLRGMGSGLTLATAGLKLCYPFFPNRYKARYRGGTSAWEAWYDEKHMKRAIRWQLNVGDPVSPRRVLRAVCANVRTSTVFRPAVAAALYRQFCPEGGSVWDPCAGFGGRLVGAVVSGVRYIATDVAPETIEGNRRLAEWLGVSDQVDLHLCPAQDFEAPCPVDMVFTSPPYFKQEIYAGGDQSWQLASLDAWVEGFLRPMVLNGFQALKPGGFWVLNIADVRDGRLTHPLEALACQVFLDVGLVQQQGLRMPLANLNRRSEGEPVFVWRKQ